MRVSAEQQIHIEQLKVSARVGVPRAERARRQRLVLNITLWPARDLRDIQDAIARTVDYSALSQEAKQFLSRQSPNFLKHWPMIWPRTFCVNFGSGKSALKSGSLF